MRQDEFFTEFDALFVELAKRARPGRFEPNTDVFLSDDGTEIIVNVEIAGVDTSELRVGVEESHLFIIGRRHDRERHERGSMLMKEIDYGEFAKRIHLPIPVADDRATASYKDGMLTIRLSVSADVRVPNHRTELQMTVRRTPA